MNDSSYYQMKRKDELNQLPKNNRKEQWISDEFAGIGILSLVFSIVIIGACLITANNKAEFKEDCESVGGRLEIVDRTFAGKSGVDIHGCVK